MSAEVELTWCCPSCGHKSVAVYSHGDRQYGDLPRCVRKCEVPFAVLDAIAAMLDERAMNGWGASVTATRQSLCGYDGAER